MKSNVLSIFLMISLTVSLLFSCEKIYVEKDETIRTDSSEEQSDYLWNQAKTINIVMNGNSVTIDSLGASADGSIITITSAGNYNISGELSNGQIIVNTHDSGIVRLILNNTSITCLNSAPIYIKDSQKVLIVLPDNSENYITDGSSYDIDSDGEPNAAIFSKSYIAFFGNGSLTLKANYNDGITGKDGLLIKSGVFNVTSADDAIRGKDFIIIHNGNLVLNAGGTGLKSDNDSDSGYGYITAESGTITVNSGGDAVHAESSIDISGGTLSLNTTGNAVLESSGSGYNASCSAGLSSQSSVSVNGATVNIKSTGKGGKGISAGGNIDIKGANITIITTGAGATYKNTSGITDCYSGTGISSDGNISITSGSLGVNCSGTAAKGISADGTLTIGTETESPVVNITTSGAKIATSGTGMYAGYAEAKAIKSTSDIIINNGIITISSADDGMKSESAIAISSATLSITKSIEGLEAPSITVNSGNVSIVASDDGFNATKGNGGEANDGSCLYLNGGFVVVSASGGDGLDSNGSMVMTGGTVIVHGPQSSPEVGMDFNGTFNISAGFLVVSGTNSNMTQAPSTSTGLYAVKATSTSSNSTLFHMQDASGNDIVTFKPLRSYYSLIVSSTGLSSGSSYSIYTGGTSTGTLKNGLYTGGVYSGGTLKKTFTVTSKITSVNF